MKLEEGAQYVVYDLEGNSLGQLRMDQGFEVWPVGVKGWKHALDCTIEPYDERTLEENLHFAAHVNKFAVVMRLD